MGLVSILPICQKRSCLASPAEVSWLGVLDMDMRTCLAASAGEAVCKEKVNVIKLSSNTLLYQGVTGFSTRFRK